MRKRFLFSIMLCLLLLLASGGALLWLYFPARPQLLFIADERYLQNHVSSRDRLELRVCLASRGYNLQIESVGWEFLGNQNLLSAQVDEWATGNVSLVVVSPLLTNDISSHKDSWSPWLQKLQSKGIQIVGLGLAVEGVFDALLSSEVPAAGWGEAADALSVLNENNPLPTVLLYTADDAQAIANAKLFSEQYAGRVLKVMPISGNSEAEIESTVEQIADMGALYVVSPYVKVLDQYVIAAKDLGLKWIVEASYSKVILANNLAGVVADDLVTSLINLLNSGILEGAGSTRVQSPLSTIYRPTGRVLQSLF